jgi:hypothetical protein
MPQAQAWPSQPPQRRSRKSYIHDSQASGLKSSALTSSSLIIHCDLGLVLQPRSISHILFSFSHNSPHRWRCHPRGINLLTALGHKLQERQSAEASADAQAWKTARECHRQFSINTDSGDETKRTLALTETVKQDGQILVDPVITRCVEERPGMDEFFVRGLEFEETWS